MARADYINEVERILYGRGPGGAPAIRQLAATSTVQVSGQTVSFDLASGEGDKVKPGQVLNWKDATTAGNCYVFYVLSVSTDTVTAVNGYQGGPSISDASTVMDSGLLYHEPLVTFDEIHQKVDLVFDHLLYPDATLMTVSTVTPVLDGSANEGPSDIVDLHAVWQTVAGYEQKVAAGIERHVHTTLSSTGVLLWGDWLDGSTAYISYKRKLVVGDESTVDGLVDLVATGAAALCLGASVTEAEKVRPKDELNKPEQILWRDFVAMRDGFNSDEEDIIEVVVDRG